MTVLLITLFNILHRIGKIALVLGILLTVFGRFQYFRKAMHNVRLAFQHFARARRGDEGLREAEAQIDELDQNPSSKTIHIYTVGFWIAFIGALVSVASDFVLSTFWG